jgi:hypothetical protein
MWSCSKRRVVVDVEVSERFGDAGLISGRFLGPLGNIHSRPTATVSPHPILPRAGHMVAAAVTLLVLYLHNALIHSSAFTLTLLRNITHRDTVMSAPTYQIPRKAVGEPLPAHLKEVDTARSVDSGWGIPQEAQSKSRRNRFGAGAGTTRWALSDRLDRILPPHKRYFGRSRRTLLIIILVAFLCLLALIIGLAAGLSSSKKYDTRSSLPVTYIDTSKGPTEPPTARRLRDLQRRVDLLRPRTRRLRYRFRRQ